VPELPDVTVYVECIAERVLGEPLEALRILSPSVLRSVEPSPADVQGRRVVDVRRIGKRIAMALEGELFVVIHLMIAGRLHWQKRGATPPRKRGHASFDFPHGTLTFTEASTKKRAMLHLVRGEDALAEHDPGGLEVLEASLDEFRGALVRENHTLKRTLTDPRLLSGIGNAYSDEILHRARLSPVKLSQKLSDDEIAALYEATGQTLRDWTERLREQTAGRFPEKVTAFRPEMAVHGRYKAPCPDCGSPVQRIVRAESEVNYCATCQTGGRLLADRALSRLLKKDWPRTLEELEQKRGASTKG
jgi:formamidopyrimidine-DNA glycosylase